MKKFAEIGMLLGIYGGLLTDRQRDAMDLYYNYDLSLSEIGEQLEISRQGVHDIVKRGEQILLNAEESVGAFGYRQKLLKAIDSITEELGSITQRPDETFSEDVSKIKRDLKGIENRILKLRDV